MQQIRTRVSSLDGTKSAKELKQSVGNLGKSKLLAKANPRPAAERDVLPAKACGQQLRHLSHIKVGGRGKIYLTRRSDSQRSGRNSSASGPNTSLFRCSPWLDHRTGVPFATSIGWLPSLPPPLGRMVSLFAVLEFVATGLKSRNAKRQASGVSFGG